MKEQIRLAAQISDLREGSPALPAQHRRVRVAARWWWRLLRLHPIKDSRW
jgi:hypothetical protein